MRAHVRLLGKHGGGWVEFIDGRLLYGLAQIVRWWDDRANVFERRYVPAGPDHVGVSLGEDGRRKLGAVLNRAMRDLLWRLILDGHGGPADSVQLRIVEAHLLPQSGHHVDAFWTHPEYRKRMVQEMNAVLAQR